MNRFFLLLLCFALFALAACSDNLFGSPSNSGCGSDIKCLRLDAENAFRSGNYAKAYKIYEQIVSIDSTVSLGYFGMAKSGLWMKGINPFEVFAHVKKGEEGEIAFMDKTPDVQNRFYRGMIFVVPALRELEKRDTLTAHYEYHKRNISDKFDTIFVRAMDSASWARAVDSNGFTISNIGIIDNEDGKNKTYRIPLSEKLKKFRKTYCNAKGDCSNIPLSDREYRYGAYTGGLLISTIMETILKSLDTNKDHCITKKCPKDVDPDSCFKYDPGDPKKPENHRVWENWECDKKNGGYSYDLPINLVINDEGGLEIDIDQILTDLDLESFYSKQQNSNEIVDIPDEINSFNNHMNDFSEGIYEIITVMGSFKDKSNSDEVPFGWEDDMKEYKGVSAFYRVGTNIDEDGDGCIGEELLDGNDNDGDGFRNGNARLASVDPLSPFYARDGAMMGYHGMTGDKEDDMPIRIDTGDPAFANKCIIASDPTGTLCSALTPDEYGYVTVMKFTQKPGYWTSYIIEDKLMVAQDTVCPPKISLEKRRELIGGCWPNYDEDKFVKYWLKRGLARPADRDTRVHSTCKNCKTTAECLGK
jgi:hypothetical protein